MSLSSSFLDELRARTLLSALIGKTLKITKAGREFKGCCPFHNEKTPSFYVNDDKGFYHCFGCSAHGDAIRWMTDQRGLGFMDAVKELADTAGLQLPAPDPRAAEQAERANSLYDVMTAAADWFVEQLGGIEGADARAYLEMRGIKAATIKAFGIGYAPDARGKLKAALTRFGEDKLIDTGMLIKVEDKDSYDRFRGRLMIPIRDPRGRVIAFGGRILGAGEPKYLNSPDTPLFDKGRTLYNLDRAGPESRKTNRVLVVEGYMDVIALAQAGITDAVAPLGTALTEHQLERLWRMTEKPIICFDGDGAGQKAALRAAHRALGLLKPGHSLQFAKLPEGQDPDDLLKSSGAGAFLSVLESSEPLVQRLWEAEVSARSLATPEDRASLKQRLRGHISSISDKDVRSHYADAFCERFDKLFSARPKNGVAPNRRDQNATRSSLRSSLRSNDDQVNRSITPEVRGINTHGSDLLVQWVIGTLLRHPSLIAEHCEALSCYKPRLHIHSELISKIVDISISRGVADSGSLLSALSPELMDVASSIMQGDAKVFALNNEDLSLRKIVAEMILLMTGRPSLELALQQATRRASEELTEENYAQQQYLRIQKEAFDQRIYDVLRDG
jgi:DNA primase